MTEALKNHYLQKTGDFQRVLRGRKRVYSENFVIFYEKNFTQGNFCRFGIAVPQKTVKKVVLRNRYKRQVKCILLELQHEKKEGGTILRGGDLLVIIRKNFIVEKFNKKKDNLRDLLGLFTRRIFNK